MKHLRFVLILLLSVNFVFAQKPFEGKVTFGVKLLGEMDMIGAFMPDSYEYSFKEGDMLFKMNGGITSSLIGDVLIKGKEGVGYMIKHSEKTIYKIESKESTEKTAKNTDTKVENTGEKETILGYDCAKYKVTINSDGNTVTQYMWVTNQLNLKMPKKSSEIPSGNNIFIDGLEGFPLKIQSTVPMVDATMVMTATEVKEQPLDKNLFKVPAGYEEKTFDPKSLLGY